MPDYTIPRLNMVESQVRTNDVTDVRIQEVMREIARERFVPAGRQGLAYADSAVEIVHGRYLLDPRTFAKLAQLATIEPTDRLLDVGCASGYSTAVFSRLCSDVTALEEDAELVRIATDALLAYGGNLRVVQGRLADGNPAGAPYDVIFLNGAVEVAPDTLLQQLGEGGRLVAVVQNGPQGRANIYVREHGRIGNRTEFDATAPVLPGFRRARGFVF